MKINLNNEVVFASTGGRPFESKGDPLWFIHGSGQSHLSFILQGRFFANRGWPVIAADMPSHGLSSGVPLTSIQAMSDWQIALMDEIGIERVQIIGHSQGGLIGLDMAHRYPDRVSQLSLVATALSIPVNSNLIEMAKNKEQSAIDAMIDWVGEATSLTGMGRAINENMDELYRVHGDKLIVFPNPAFN